MLCKECQSRSVCQSSCPELEFHLREIERPQRELLIGTPRYGRFPMPKKRIKLTKREQQIVTYLVSGTDDMTICQVLNITKRNYDVIWLRLRAKTRGNL